MLKLPISALETHEVYKVKEPHGSLEPGVLELADLARSPCSSYEKFIYHMYLFDHFEKLKHANLLAFYYSQGFILFMYH